jgi:putative ABC transport system permease protein
MRFQHWFYTIPLRFRSFFRRAAVEKEMDEEFHFHLERQMDMHLAKGLSPEEARYATLRALGGISQRQEECRDMWKVNLIDALVRDIRYAGRALRKNPGFTLVAVLTLGLAVGANASIFAVVYRVLLNPLPYGNSDRLIDLGSAMPSRNIPSINLTTRLYYQYLDRDHTLDGLALYQTDELTLTGQGTPERIRVSRATASLASVLRVAPVKGRWLSEQDELPGATPVGVISHGLWARRFGQDPSVLGRSMRLDNAATTIVGVMPASYAFPDPGVEVWIAFPLTRATASDAYSIPGVARLRDGATVAGARAELSRLNADLASEYPDGGYGQLVSSATTLMEATTGRVSRTLWILLASVGLVMLVACANVANLFLVRSEARQREVAVRRALGASSRAISSYFLSESLMLSFAGGALGLALARIAVDLLIAYGPANLPRLEEVRIDSVTTAFTLALSLLNAIVFGAIPLLRRAPLGASLHESGRGNTASRGRHRARQLLMGGQIALALVLLVLSGLMLRSFQKLRAVDPGFDAASALTFRVGLPRSEYPNRVKMAVGHRAILDRLSSLPGVAAVSASTCLPLSDGCTQGGPLFVEGRVLSPGANPPIVGFHAVAGGYFEVMGMRLLRGRGIDRRDVERNEPVVVINEALANILFPRQDPIGQRVWLGVPSTSADAPGRLTIAGVVSNTPARALNEAIHPPRLYMPIFWSRETNISARLDAMSYVLRTKLPPLSLTGPVRGRIAEVDAHLALTQVRTLQDILDRASAQMAFTMVLLLIAAGVSMMLGVIGIYGVTSYIVSQRAGEIGLRLALGAQPRTIVRMFVRQGGIVALAGITLGLAGVLAGSRLIESLLFGVGPRDPAVFTATTLLLLGVALFSCWLPARRAARLSPIDALRSE